MSDRRTLRTIVSDTATAGWHVSTHSAPISRAFNHLIAGARFKRKFGRWPLPPQDPLASINDLITARMIEPEWPAHHRALVDKITAKVEVKRLYPPLRIPDTLSIIPMPSVRSMDQLYDLLTPFAGTHSIAKPSHASGGAVFLDDVTSPTELTVLDELAASITPPSCARCNIGIVAEHYRRKR